MTRALQDDTFVSRLFGQVAQEDLAAVSSPAREALAARALKRLSMARDDRGSVEVFDGTALGLTGTFVLEAINSDRPFLLDSTLEELRERGLNPRLVAHPIFDVHRTTAGLLEGLPALAHPGGTGPRESLIHIHLPQLTQVETASLKEGMERVFAQVQLAVDDFPTMQARLRAVAADYTHAPPPHARAEVAEAIAFLNWAANNHMTLLGMREYRLTDDGATADAVISSGLGILRDPDVNVLRRGRRELAMTPEILAFLKEPQTLIITKANVKSLVHRRVHMDYIGVKLFGAGGLVTGELRVVGLFTATAYNDPVSTIPYIRRKAEYVFAQAGFPVDSYSARALGNVLESYPRDELFQISPEQLEDFALDIMALNDRPRIRALARVDRFDRFVSVIVYVPKDRYDSGVRRRIGLWLAEAYQGRLSAAYPAYPEGPLARTHFIIGRDEGTTPSVDRAALEAGIADIVRTWADALREAGMGSAANERLIERYSDGFGAAYREAFSVEQAIADMATIDRLSAERQRLVNLYRRRNEDADRANLKIYSFAEPVSLSERVPLLEGLGFKVINERTYRIANTSLDVPEPVWLHDMSLARAAGGAIDIEAVEPRIEAALMALFGGLAESDKLNTLVLEAGLGWREVAMLRTLSRYAQQIRAPYSQDYIAETMNRHAGVAAWLVALFEARFNPAIKNDTRGASEADAAAAIDQMLVAVQSLDEDRILRMMRNLLQAAVRSNFYQLGPDGRTRDIIAFKFEAAKVNNLPLPRPMFEIFMHSPRLEGVHMRFGKVARGGLRWSDRPQDFRTEVLGLVKAQQVKNAVIVPVGAKGGFVPKKLPPASDRAAWLAEGTEVYKLFITTLLSLTDNRVGEGVVPPALTVRHDADDAYLVVAADKGTATFSDTANAISENLGHWLGDAFASGGSVGYDHKKMGITARGAWEAVKRHFREMDIDIQTTPFTVAGVGDMSGDVFGNGMLLSEQIQLVAAFDHRDIFIDPMPDIAASFGERQRMFALPRSSWQDYDTKLISRGGGVFPRSAKSLAISPEMKALLDLPGDTATPQEVMNAILKARVDLMWFGGIGTYIRATSETDADAGDRANDPIRVTGQDLRCKVIGEGANLGTTQRGRIEAARAGVRLNTDAIDNSAGVNSSDVEVNIKIALARPVADGRLTQEARNTLLASMTDDVAKLVLRNNYLQSLSISLSQAEGVADMPHARRLMRTLESTGRLDRKVEYLPADEALDVLESEGKALTRPELSVLLAYAKLAFHDELLASDVPDDPYFAVELRRYFPDGVRLGFPDAVDGHRLRREIIATGLANAVINRGGHGVVVRLAEETGRPVTDVARAYALTRDAFGVLEINTAIDALDAGLAGAAQLGLYSQVRQFTLDRMLWFMRHVDFTPGLSHLVQRFAEGATFAPLGPLMPVQDAIPPELARRMAQLTALAAVPDAVLVAEAAGIDVGSAMGIVSALATELDMERLRSLAARITPFNAFERLAIQRATEGMATTLRRLAAEVATSGADTAAWSSTRQSELVRIRRTVNEWISGPPTLAKLSLAAGALAELLRT